MAVVEPGAVKTEIWDKGRATYDRLRVLSTEMRRLVADGRTIRVRLGGSHLDERALARVLPWL